MNLLAFDTSTDHLSIAVQRTLPGATPCWQHSAAGGALASASLIPAILDLLRQAALTCAELDAIAFGCGPGSFTGLRTACSVAQGLAFGAAALAPGRLVVLPVDTLLVLAETARQQYAAQADSWRVSVLLDARMDQMYSADYAFSQGCWSVLSATLLVEPQAFVAKPGFAVAGNVFAVYAQQLGALAANGLDTLPAAAALVRLAPQLLAAGAGVPPERALPNYIRDNVARTTLQRAADKALADQRALAP